MYPRNRHLNLFLLSVLSFFRAFLGQVDQIVVLVVEDSPVPTLVCGPEIYVGVSVILVVESIQAVVRLVIADILLTFLLAFLVLRLLSVEPTLPLRLCHMAKRRSIWLYFIIRRKLQDINENEWLTYDGARK